MNNDDKSDEIWTSQSDWWAVVSAFSSFSHTEYEWDLCVCACVSIDRGENGAKEMMSTASNDGCGIENERDEEEEKMRRKDE